MTGTTELDSNPPKRPRDGPNDSGALDQLTHNQARLNGALAIGLENARGTPGPETPFKDMDAFFSKFISTASETSPTSVLASMPNGEQIPIDCTPASTVRSLRDEVAGRTRDDPMALRLGLDGNRLSNDRTLVQCGLWRGDTLDVSREQLGGTGGGDDASAQKKASSNQPAAVTAAVGTVNEVEAFAETLSGTSADALAPIDEEQCAFGQLLRQNPSLMSFLLQFAQLPGAIEALVSFSPNVLYHWLVPAAGSTATSTEALADASAREAAAEETAAAKAAAAKAAAAKAAAAKAAAAKAAAAEEDAAEDATAEKAAAVEVRGTRELRDREQLKEAAAEKAAAAAAEAGVDNALMQKSRRRRSRKEGTAASAAETGIGNATVDLKRIGVERVTELSRKEEDRLRKCASGGAKNDKKKPANERSTPLPYDIPRSLTNGDIVLLRCKPNSGDGMQPGTDFKNLRILLHLTSKSEAWSDGVRDADFYEYSFKGCSRFLLSPRAFEALEKDATHVHL